MVSHNTVWIVQSLEQPEVANSKVDAIVGMKGGNVQFTASVKMIFSNWSFLGYPKGVKN